MTSYSVELNCVFQQNFKFNFEIYQYNSSGANPHPRQATASS